MTKRSRRPATALPIVGLGDAARVHVGGVDVVDAQVGRPVDDVGRLSFVAVVGEGLVLTEYVGAQADDRDSEAAVSKLTVLHRTSFLDG